MRDYDSGDAGESMEGEGVSSVQRVYCAFAAECMSCTTGLVVINTRCHQVCQPSIRNGTGLDMF